MTKCVRIKGHLKCRILYVLIRKYTGNKRMYCEYDNWFVSHLHLFNNLHYIWSILRSSHNFYQGLSGHVGMFSVIGKTILHKNTSPFNVFNYMSL